MLNANKGGTFNLTLKPSAAAKKLLRKKGKLKVTAQADLHADRRDGEAARPARVTLKLASTEKAT